MRLSRRNNVLRSLLVQVGIERFLLGDVLTLQWIPAAISRPKKPVVPASKKRIPPFLNTNVSIGEGMEIMDDKSAGHACVGGFGTADLHSQG